MSNIIIHVLYTIQGKLNAWKFKLVLNSIVFLYSRFKVDPAKRATYSTIQTMFQPCLGVHALDNGQSWAFVSQDKWKWVDSALDKIKWDFINPGGNSCPSAVYCARGGANKHNMVMK